MSSNEEYLDNLLKSMGDGDTDFSDDGEDFSADIEAMYEELQKSLEKLDESGENVEVPSAESSQPEESEPEDMSEFLNGFDMSEIEEITNESEMSELSNEVEKVFSEEPQTEEERTEEVSEADESTPTVESVPTVESTPTVESAPTVESKPTMESTQEMSQDEIESMLGSFESQEDTVSENASEGADVMESSLEEKPAMDKEEEDILALLDSIQDDDSVGEINELLSKADNNEAVDESIFTEETESASAEIAALLGEGSGEEDSQSEDENAGKKKEKKKKIKKEKVKKEKVPKEPDGEQKAPKEPGFFGKIFSKLTEEDEPEPISEENQNIMKELEAEDAAEAGKDKQIKEGLMPGKEGGEEGESADKKGKKDNKGKKKDTKKKEKPKKETKPKKEKPKKEKPQKEPAVPEKPGKKISKASIIVILLFAGTVFGVIFFASSFLSGMLQKQHAKDAFSKQDYLSCYEDLYGQNLSEEEEMMFHHARTVLKVERRLTRYERYLSDYQILEALDTLMQALADYEELYVEAQSYGAEAEVNSYYARIYEILESDYGLSREAAHAIAYCDSKVEYTRYLTALAEGEQISVNGSNEGLTLPETEMQDVLPVEEELLPPAFMN